MTDDTPDPPGETVTQQPLAKPSRDAGITVKIGLPDGPMRGSTGGGGYSYSSTSSDWRTDWSDEGSWATGQIGDHSIRHDLPLIALLILVGGGLVYAGLTVKHGAIAWACGIVVGMLGLVLAAWFGITLRTGVRVKDLLKIADIVGGLRNHSANHAPKR